MQEATAERLDRCPICPSQPMRLASWGKLDVELNACSRCRGIWFDGGEFESLFDFAALCFRCEPGGRPSKWQCPRCSRRLRSNIYPQTDAEILMCVDCDGIWLYPKEIAQIKQTRIGLRRKQKLDRYAPVIGLKGRWIEYVNQTIKELS